MTILFCDHGVSGTREELGFQEFLDRVESDHFRRMIDSPAMFERYLPYVMGHHFRPTLFVSGLGSMSHRVGSVMTSQPRSSGGSGFGGGGGFSGDGFGGGGGRF